MKRRAWLTEWNGVKSIVFATTRNKAKYKTYLSAQEAGYTPKLTEVKIKRAPKHDNSPLNGMPALKTYSLEFAEESLQ